MYVVVAAVTVVAVVTVVIMPTLSTRHHQLQ